MQREVGKNLHPGSPKGGWGHWEGWEDGEGMGLNMGHQRRCVNARTWNREGLSYKRTRRPGEPEGRQMDIENFVLMCFLGGLLLKKRTSN